MNVFIRAMIKIFSFGERWNFPFDSAVASWNGKFHLSPRENIFTIALINIHYLYNVQSSKIYPGCDVIKLDQIKKQDGDLNKTFGINISKTKENIRKL